MAYALNRDILTLEQKRAVVAEYKARRKTTKGFSEWFTIDPAYPSFKGYKPGDYVNGAATAFELSTVGDSRYVDADVQPQGGIVDLEVLY